MKLGIHTKLLIFFFCIGVLPLAAYMWWEYKQTKEILRNKTYDQLKTVRETKKREIEGYFEELNEEVKFFAQSKVVIDAISDFGSAYRQLKKQIVINTNQKNALKSYYTEYNAKLGPFADSLQKQNPIPEEPVNIFLQNQYLLGNKNQFFNNAYNIAHEKYHHTISAMVDGYEIYDLLLVDDETGTILYSVLKEPDFATSLLTGPYSNTNLGDLFRKMRFTGLEYSTAMSDYQHYYPSKILPSAFVAAPIFEGNRKIGTLIVQVSLKKIDQITTGKKAWKDEGFGETGETYLVGNDKKMRSDSRFIIESPKNFLQLMKKNKAATDTEIAWMSHFKTSILFQKINSEAVQKALSGIQDTKTVVDYRHKEVISSFTPLVINGFKWCLLVEIDVDEIYENINKGARQSILLLLIFTVLSAVVSLFFALSISKPILQLAKASRELADGNLDVRVEIATKDELEELSLVFNKAVESIKSHQNEILEKNYMLENQQSELLKQAQDLQLLNEEIKELNIKLDDKVKLRTLKLIQQNTKLLEYAHINSHKLRGPIATILGLMILLKNHATEPKEIEVLLKHLESAVNLLDETVHHIQLVIEDAEFKDDQQDFVS